MLAAKHGRWRKQVDDYPFEERLYDDKGLGEDQVADLILNKSALDMAMNAADGIWRHARHQAGRFTTTLNRNVG